MSIKGSLKDGTGSNREARVDDNHALLVSNSGIPSQSSMGISQRPFVGFMKNNSSSKDVRVDGSGNYVDFTIGSSSNGERYIKLIAFTISDSSAVLSKFGTLNPLTNGCQLIYQDDKLGDVLIADDLRTNFDIVQLCNFKPSFGSGVDAFRAKDVVGNSDAFVPTLNVAEVFGLQYGFYIPKGSTRKLIFRVRDNLSSGIDRLDIKVFGNDIVTRP